MSSVHGHFGLEILRVLKCYLRKPFAFAMELQEQRLSRTILAAPFLVSTTSRLGSNADSSISVDVSTTAKIWFTNTRGNVYQTCFKKRDQTKRTYSQELHGRVALYADNCLSTTPDLAQLRNQQLPLQRTNVAFVFQVGNLTHRHTRCELVFIVPAIESRLSEDEHRYKAQETISTPVFLKLTIQDWIIRMVSSLMPQANHGANGEFGECAVDHDDDVHVSTHRISSLESLGIPTFVHRLNRTTAWHLPAVPAPEPARSTVVPDTEISCKLNIRLCPGNIDDIDVKTSSKRRIKFPNDITLDLNFLEVGNVYYELRERVGQTICLGAVDQSCWD